MSTKLQCSIIEWHTYIKIIICVYVCVYIHMYCILQLSLTIYVHSLNQSTTTLNHSFMMCLLFSFIEFWHLALNFFLIIFFFSCLSSLENSIKLIVMCFNRLSESTYITFRNGPCHILLDPLVPLHLVSQF